MNDAIALSREILNAHPTGVRSLFRRYNLGMEPDPRSMVLATAAFGPAFTNDLYALYKSGHNYDGTDELTAASNDLFYGSADTSNLQSGLGGASGSLLDPGLINYNDSLIYPAGTTPVKYTLSGTPVSTPVAATKTNTSFENFSKSFNNVLGLIGSTVTTGANIYNTVKTGQTAQTVNQGATNAQSALTQSAAQIQLEQAAAAAKTKQMLIIGVVLIGVILAGFLVFRKR